MCNTASVVSKQAAVLVVVDIQERLAAVMERRSGVVDSTMKLVRVAALTGMPIVATRQSPAGLGDLDQAVAGALAEAEAVGTRLTRVDKVAFDCFADPAFVEAIGQAGGRQLVVVGMETHICIAQTALAALRRGLDVHVVADACCSRNAAAHEVALARLRAAGAAVTTWESAAYEVVGAAGTDEFRELLGIVKG
jgi:nicotinamidase-related amidase